MFALKTLNSPETESLETFLALWSEGDHTAAEGVLSLAYAELRKVAAMYFRHERPGHVFWGLTDSEIATALESSVATVKRDWSFARAWLLSRLRVKC
jgi:hypothetical protein